MALILAFFSYRHGLPLTLRSALYPIIGDRIYGPVGHAVDIFAVIGHGLWRRDIAGLRRFAGECRFEPSFRGAHQ
ncbi:BCCT family transporter [Klebsiella pneumoniae]|uniref:BCCT family transporter n=1 Tax=Klebsiella pneumoniae TaxID=573 RepID=UPI000DF02C44|nr:BCCT family transporter [Klebsiella pneumoniae]BBE64525.1 Secondary glycine betaine transporter BetU [Klebsiella pneumoniae]